MIPTLSRLAGVALCCASPLFAQSDGPALGTPAVVFVDVATVSATGPLPPDELLRKGAGFGPVTPTGRPGAASVPSFTSSAIWGGGVAPPPFTVDAYSIGLDEVLATIPLGGLSWVAVPPAAWGAVEFSVTSASVGRPGTVVASEAATLAGAGADVFSLMLDGSSIPPSTMSRFPFDRPQRGLDSTQMGLAGPTGTTPGDIKAVDYYTPLYEVGAPITPPILPPEPRVFFSVDEESLYPSGGGSGTVPPSWFGATLPSAATILVTKWNGTMGLWGTPSVHLSYDQLGLDLHDDIDALAVDVLRCKILFSIVKTATSTLRDQLQIVYWTKTDSFSTTTSVGAYVTSDGTGTGESVARRAGVDVDDDIDAVCTIDPGNDGGTGSLTFGSPALVVSPFLKMAAQVYRDKALGGVPTITTVVSGVPTVATFPTKMLELWLASPTGGFYTLFPFPFYAELLDGSVPSDTRTVSFPDPALGALFGVDLDFIWVQRPPAPTMPSAVVMRISL